MLNSAASALVNTEPAVTFKRELIGRNLASEYGNMEGKTESLKEQLESMNVINRDELNDRIQKASQNTETEDGHFKQSQINGNITERKHITPGTERNKRVLPTTPKSLYSTPSQSATSINQSTEKGLDVTSKSKRLSMSSSISSASNTSLVSSTSSEPEDLRFKTNTRQTHIALYKFVARHDDEISLDTGDAVHVNKKCEDLWYEGINLRTGQAGIFPSRYVSDILQGTSIQGKHAFVIIIICLFQVEMGQNSCQVIPCFQGRHGGGGGGLSTGQGYQMVPWVGWVLFRGTNWWTKWNFLHHSIHLVSSRLLCKIKKIVACIAGGIVCTKFER